MSDGSKDDHSPALLPAPNEVPLEGAKPKSFSERLWQGAEKVAKATAEAASKAKENWDEAAKRRAEEKAERDAQAQAAAERQRLLDQKRFEAQRRSDIAKALSRNISTGGAGVPYRVIDVVFAVGVSGGTGRGDGARPGDAFEEVKEKLWAQCKYLGGDAVLFCRYGWDKDLAHIRNTGAALTNAVLGTVGALAKTNVGQVNEVKTETVLTLWGYGTVVKLLEDASIPVPDDLADMPPGLGGDPFGGSRAA